MSRPLTLVIDCREPGCGRERTVALAERYWEQFAKLNPQKAEHQLRMLERLISDGCEAILRCSERGHCDVGWEVAEVPGNGRRPGSGGEARRRVAAPARSTRARRRPGRQANRHGGR